MTRGAPLPKPKPRPKADHWPGGIQPRVWAAEIRAGRAEISDVPHELREWVRYYLGPDD